MIVGKSLSIRIVILNYNGADLLPQCLPSLHEAAKKSKYPVTVAVLDNLSSDSSLDYVRAHFPEIEIEIASQNRVLCSYNEYLQKIPETVVILLNNDIRVAPDFIDPLMEKFLDEPETFMVAPRVMSFDGKKIEAAASKAGMRFGMFWCNARYPGYEKDAMIASKTFSSGFGAFSREKFLALRGYDERYLPGIMEDVDLCLRAQRSGYPLYYEPRSVVYHMGQATFKKKFGARGISTMAHRNNFLFMWKNYSGPGFWLPHLFFLPLRLAYAALKGNWGMIEGFISALGKRKPR